MIAVWWAKAQAKVVAWLAAIGVVLAAIAAIYLKGRSDSKASNGKRTTEATAKAERAARARAEAVTEVVTSTTASVQQLPPAHTPFATGVQRDAEGTPVVTLRNANPKSAAGRLAGLARAKGAE